VIDPIVQAAFAVQANPGGYLLLVGSGISRGAEIPTGWDVVLDLLRKVAALSGDDAGPDPAAWYRARFDAEPEYSHLIGQIAAMPEERRAILRGYFEPTEDERSRGAKGPTAAHRAIAGLVAAGYIKVVLTTNFDRLLEDALAEVGVRPYVVRAAPDAAGMPPMSQVACLIVKANGDYLDTRIRNTPAELASYEPELDRLLDRLLDEYGLIVCGWSSDWDEALRNAIRRIPHRRLTSFWFTRSEPSALARDLIANRGAIEIRGQDADAFFADLSQKINALADLRAMPPGTVDVAVATAKRLLADPSGRIRLRDLAKSETNAVLAVLDGIGDDGGDSSEDEFERRIVRIEGATAKLAAILATGAYWGDTEHISIWVEALQRVGDRGYDQGYRHLNWLRGYPATILLYSASVAALAASRYGNLTAILKAPIRRGSDQAPAAYVLEAGKSLERDAMTRLRRLREGKPNTRYHVPASQQLRGPVRAATMDLVPDEHRFDEVFYRAEAFVALAHADYADSAMTGVWFPRGLHLFTDNRILGKGTLADLAREVAEQKDSWPPVAAQLFTTAERAGALIQGYVAQANGDPDRF
jgi:hypothetical protein